MLLIDTHAHIADKKLFKDPEQEARGSLSEKVWVINSGVDKKTSKEALYLAEKFEEGVYAAVGMQPEALLYNPPEKFDEEYFYELSKNKKVVAIGEAGLDFHYLRNFKGEELENKKEEQKELFLKNLELSKKSKKPMVIHCRNAYDELIKMLNDFKGSEKGLQRGSVQIDPSVDPSTEGSNTSTGSAQMVPSIDGTTHCFSGSEEQARQLLDIGLHLGFTGIITFSKQMDEVIKEIPIERILIETDSPYLTPVPHRGEKNKPQYVKYVAQRISEIKGIEFEKVAEQTTKNARDLFGF